VNGPAPSDRRPNTPAVVPVGPSRVVKLVMAPVSKALNPLVAKVAGRRHFGVTAQIHHVGRRSGTRYVTTVGARVNGEVVLIPLTFGNQADWARNVRTAGECLIQVNGDHYRAAGPQFRDARDVRPLVRGSFKPIERLAFRLLRIKQFMQLDVAADAGSQRSGEITPTS
jgi:deazaflavin-dependent oxidoreductase (nitroreductase family)